MAQPQVDILIKATTQGFTQVLAELSSLTQALNGVGQSGVMQTLNNLSSQFNSLSTSVGALTTKIGTFEAAIKQQNQAIQTGARSMLTMKMSLQSYMEDVEKMILVQARWYGARMLLFAAVGLPFEAVKSILEYTVALDTARSEILRFAATSGSLTKQMISDADQMVLAMRRALVEVPVTFADLNKAIQSFVGAGVAPNTIIEMTEYVAKLKNAFPEINMETFAVALTGAFNQFGASIKGATTEAEKFKIIMETLLRAQAVGIIRPEQFTKVMQYMGPISTLAGFTLQQMSAIAVTVTDMGRRAESASRLAAGFMVSLVSPKAAAHLEKIGILIDKNKSLAAQFDNIATQMVAKIGTGEVPLGSLQFISGLTSSDRLGVFIAFLQNYEKYVALTKDLEGATGGLSASSDAMTMSLAKKWQLIINLFKEFGQVISGDTKGALNALLGVAIEVGKALLIAADNSGMLAVKFKEIGVVGSAFALLFLTVKALGEGIYAAFVTVGMGINGIVGIIFHAAEKIFGFLGNSSITEFISPETAKRAREVAASAKEIKDNSYTAVGVGLAELTELRKRWLEPSSAPYEMKATSANPRPRTATEGTGIDVDEGVKGRVYDDKLITNTKKRFSTMYDAEESSLKANLSGLDLLYKKGLISTENYFAYKEELIGESTKRELKILDDEKAALISAYKTLEGNLNSRAKLKPDEKERGTAQLKESREVDIEVLETKKKKTIDKSDEREAAAKIAATERKVQVETKAIDTENRLLDASTKSREMAEEKSIRARAMRNEWLYSHNLTSSQEYFSEAKRLIEEQTETDTNAAQKRYDDDLAALERRQALYGEESDAYKQLQEDKKLLTANFQNTKKAIENKGTFDSIALDQRENERKLQVASRAIDVENRLSEASGKYTQMQEEQSASARYSKNEYLYSQSLITATEYYAEAQRLIDEQVVSEKEALIRRYADDYVALTKKQELMDQESDGYKQLQDQKTVLTAQFQNSKAAIENRGANETLALNQKQMVDYRALYEGPNGFVAVSKQAFIELDAEMFNHGKIMVETWKNITQSLATTFSDFFTDVVEGKVKSLNDYIGGFARSVYKIFAEIAAKQVATMVTKGVMMGVTALVGHEGGMIEAHSGGYIPEYHTGGYISEYHGGGLAPDERVGILQTRERVLSRDQTIMMDEMHKRVMDPGGKSPQVQVNVINQSSQNVSAEQQSTKFDMEKMVVSVVLKDMNSNGPLYGAVKGVR